LLPDGLLWRPFPEATYYDPLICFGDGTFFVEVTVNSVQTQKSIHVQKVKLSALLN